MDTRSSLDMLEGWGEWYGGREEMVLVDRRCPASHTNLHVRLVPSMLARALCGLAGCAYGAQNAGSEVESGCVEPGGVGTTWLSLVACSRRPDSLLLHRVGRSRAHSLLRSFTERAASLNPVPTLTPCTMPLTGCSV